MMQYLCKSNTPLRDVRIVVTRLNGVMLCQTYGQAKSHKVT